MRAVRYSEFRLLPEVVTVDAPACPEAGVVIEVVATGLCRSDWHGWMGHDPGVALPHVPGHEFAGVVAEVGPEVARWRAGERVTVPFVCACGECPTCRRGEQQVCDVQFQPGFTHWGSFAERVAVHRADINLVRVPDEMDLETAASLGCRFGTAYRAVVHHGEVGPGDWVAVHGCGGVGLSAVMIAAARGARVVAVDVSPAALELAVSVGAVETIDASQVEVVPAVRRVTEGGARVSIDALGSVTTCQNSIRGLRKRGRHIQIGLLVAADALPPVPMAEVVAGELEVIGSHGMSADAYPAMLAEVMSRSLEPQRLVTRRLSLDDVPEALVGMGQRPGSGIAMVRP